jgi:hypothetical protein
MICTYCKSKYTFVFILILDTQIEARFSIEVRNNFDVNIFKSECFDSCFIKINAPKSFIKNGTDSEKRSQFFIYDHKILMFSARPVKNNNHSLSITNPQDFKFIERFRDLNSANFILKFRFFIGKKSLETNKKCSILHYNASSDRLAWNQSLCFSPTPLFTHNDAYLECVCKHQSIYGLVNLNNEFYYGFSYDFYYVSVCFVLVSIFVTLLNYFICFKKLYTFFSFYFVQFLFAVFFSQIFYLVVIVASRSHDLLKQSAYFSNFPNKACTFIGVLLHYFLVAQFFLIFYSIFNFYLVYVNRNKKTNWSMNKKIEHDIFICFINWLSPVLLLFLFYLITGLVYEYVLNYSSYFIYTDVFENNEFCFIKNKWTYLGGLVLPCAFICVLSAYYVIKIFKIYFKRKRNQILLPKLKNYDLKEIGYVFIFYVLIVLLNAIMFIQMRYGYYWQYVLVCFLNFLISLYVFVIFFIVLNANKAFHLSANIFNYFERKEKYFEAVATTSNHKLKVNRYPSYKKPQNFRTTDLDYLFNYLHTHQEKKRDNKKGNEKNFSELNLIKNTKSSMMTWMKKLDSKWMTNKAYLYQLSAYSKQTQSLNKQNSIIDGHVINSSNSKKLSICSDILTILDEELFDMTNC